MMWFAYFLGGLTILLGGCLLLAIPLVRRHRLKNPRSPEEFDLPFENIRFSTTNHLVIKGWWIPSRNSERTIIMLHGYGGSMDPDLKYVPHLHTARFNVLMFDFRAHGRSGGRISTIGALERKDVLGAVNYAVSRGSRRIGLLGFSMGGRAAILSAPLSPEVNALISDGGPARLITAISRDLALRRIPLPVSKILAAMILIGASILSGTNLFRREPLYQAKLLINKPVFFIHGEKDPFITKNEIEKMVRDAGDKAELWSVPEAGHRNIDESRPDEYIHKVIGFFEKTL